MGESFCFWLFRLSIYSSLMNQVWLFLFLSRPRARLLLWAGRFLSVPPRLHPGIFREGERKGGRKKKRESRANVRPVSLRGQFLRSRVLLSACLPDLM